MAVVAAYRVRNEARWIERSIASVLPLVDHVAVFDDHSTDATRCMARKLGAEVFESPFTGLDEARDKNWFLGKLRHYAWVLWIDGDEVLEPASIPQLNRIIDHTPANIKCVSFRVKYLWDDEQHVRVDGVYGNFRRQSMFRPGNATFTAGPPPNFHVGNVPRSLWGACAYPEHVSLLHLGYMQRVDRVRKYEWYNRVDPNNVAEDGYRHMVVGDLFPAESVFRHGGPLKVEAL